MLTLCDSIKLSDFKNCTLCYTLGVGRHVPVFFQGCYKHTLIAAEFRISKGKLQNCNITCRKNGSTYFSIYVSYCIYLLPHLNKRIIKRTCYNFCSSNKKLPVEALYVFIITEIYVHFNQTCLLFIF